MALSLICTEMMYFFTTTLHFAVAAIVSISVLGLTVIFYRLFLHPLSAIPGPRLAAVSNIWHAYHVRSGRMAELGKVLHQQYGPMVRIGPNEVWFDTKEAFQAIYSKREDTQISLRYHKLIKPQVLVTGLKSQIFTVSSTSRSLLSSH